MRIKMQKVWFKDGKLMTEDIPEKKIYWQGLTQKDIDKAWEWAQKDSRFGITRIESFAQAIEAKLKEKNI